MQRAVGASGGEHTGGNSPTPTHAPGASLDRRFQALVERSSEGIALLDADGTMLYSSPAIRHILGFTPEEVVGHSLLELVHPADHELANAALVELKANPGKAIVVRCRNRHKNDGWRWTESTVTNLLDDPDVRAIVSNVRDITVSMRVQSELIGALRDSENLVKTIPDVLYGLDLEGRVIRWNRRAEIITGWSGSELFGKPALDFFAEDDRPRVAAAIAGALQNGFSEIEARMKHRDGTLTPYHYTGVPLRDETGEIIGLTGIGRDITERVRAERQRAALLDVFTTIAGTLDLEELFDRVQRQTAHVLPCDGVIIFKSDRERGSSRAIAHYGIPVALAPLLETIEFPLGQPFDGRLGQGEAFVLNEVAREPWLPELFRLQLPLRAVLAVPLRVRGRNLGALTAFNLTDGCPFTHEQVELARGIAQQLAVAIEAAELYRKQQQEAAVSQALARLGHEMIAMLDTPVLLERLGELAVEMLDCDYSHIWLIEESGDAFTAAAIQGGSGEQREVIESIKLPRNVLQPLFDRLAYEDFVPIQEVLTNETPFGRLPAKLGISGGIVLALRRGSEIVGLLTAGFHDGREAFTLEQRRIAVGIAQLGSLALQSARLVGQLERANRLKSDFVATMSHELRTPLNIILGYNDLVLEGEFGPLMPEQKEALQRVESSARTLLELITATLDMSRLESGRLPIHPGDVDLPALIAEIDSEVRDIYEDKPRIEFRWKVTSPLPPLHTDRAKLKVILKNLIGNAIKFTDQGSVEVRIGATGRSVEFQVVDSGIGIATEMLPLIFEPFRQVDSSTTRRHGGVGLGLHIVQRLVDLLGGTISVESEPARGSCFQILLPLSAPAR